MSHSQKQFQVRPRLELSNSTKTQRVKTMKSCLTCVLSWDASRQEDPWKS